jgi:oxygen-independent coproporphyrinogen-3 oxidase
MVAHAMKRFRAAGVQRINFDLIYGLPYQTAEDLRRTVEQCVEMQPARVALFGYAHVPWVAKNQRMIPEESLPQSDLRAEQADAAAEALVKGGYVRIGIDHFALPDDSLAVAAKTGELHRNFQGYTSDAAQTLIGIGATSIGRTPSGYLQNISETGAWARAVADGKLPIARGHSLTQQDNLRAHVIERIMCDGKIDLAAAGRAFGFADDWYAPEQEAIDELQRDGVVVCDKDKLTLTPAGVRLSRVVASVFDTYLRNSSVRHSIAV